MDGLDLPQKVKQQVRQALAVLRIIVFGLASGVAIFAAIVLLQDGEVDEQAGFGISGIMAIFAAPLVVGRIFIPGFIFRGARKQIADTPPPKGETNVDRASTDVPQLVAALQTTTIIAGALLDGAAFANLIAYMQERQLYSLVISGLMLLGILALFPLQIDNWLARQLRWLDEERSFNRLDR
jgi:hypothetical protein